MDSEGQVQQPVKPFTQVSGIGRGNKRGTLEKQIEEIEER